MLLAALPSIAVAGALIAASAAAQPLPDCLIGNAANGFNNMVRLIDRNADGVYDQASVGQDEVYDYYGFEFVLHQTRFTDVVPSPWQPGAFYVTDGEYDDHRDAIITYFRDLNANGVIEQFEAFPAITELFTEGDPESEAMTTDGQAIYWVRNAGTLEGVWRSVDLNGDGDFMDTVGGVPETTPAVVEATGDPINGSNAHPIANQTGSAVFNPDEVQRIAFDPWTSPGSLATGRFIIEDETLDQSLALEDLNGDGDFYDAGEIYVWAVMWNGGGLSADVHPDVANATLPSCNDWAKMAIDTSTTPTTYYVLNTDGAVGQLDGNSVWRCQDLNNDGDVNDSGEVNLYFQALDGDPDQPFDFLSGIALWGGELFVVGDSLDQFDHDRIVRLVDANADNTINNATEVVVVFDAAGDMDLEQLNFFTPGLVGPAPAGFPATIQYVDGATCVTSGGSTQKLHVRKNVYGQDLPKLGRTVELVTTDAPPSTLTALHLGPLFGVPIPLDAPANTCLVSVDPGSGTAISGFTTSATGYLSLPVSVPLAPAMDGLNLWFQTLSVDFGINPFNVTTSNTVRLQIGSFGYSTPQPAP